MLKLWDLLFWIQADKNWIRKATADIKTEFKKVGDDLEKNLWKNTLWWLERKLDTLKKKLKDVEIWSREFKTLQKEIQKTESRLDGVNQKTSLLTKSFKLLWSLIAVGTVLQVWKSIITLWSNLEQAQISFEVMLWSAEKARALLFELSEFAKKTPFELIGLRQDAKLLLAMWIQMEDLIPTMTILWNAAAWLWVEFNRLALAYGQVMAKGKLQGGELMQFTEAWVPIIRVLAKELGVSTEQFYKMVEAWQISSDLVTLAFQRMSEEGGPFFNLMARQSETLWGTWSNLKDTASQLGEWIGVSLIPFLKWVIKVLNWMISILPYVWAGFKTTFTFLLWIVWKFAIDGISLLANFIGFFANIKTNLAILIDNFWIAFDNLPWAIWRWLDIAIEKVERFINFVGKWIKKLDGFFWGALSSALWSKWWFSDITLWRVWWALWNQPKFKDFQLWSVSQKLDWAWSKFLDEQLAKINGFYNFKPPEWITWGSTLDNIITPDIWAWSWDGKGKDKEKEMEKIKKEAWEKENERLKAEMDQIEAKEKLKKQLDEKEAERNDKRKKKLDELKNTYEELGEVFEDEIKKSEDSIDDFTDSIEDLQKKLEDLKEDQKKNKENIIDFWDIWRRKLADRVLEDYAPVLDQLWKDDIVSWWFTVWELREYIKLKEEEKELNNEIALWEDELVALEVKKNNEEIILQDFNTKKIALDENYKTLRDWIEQSITDTVFQESVKQEQIQSKLIAKWKAVASARREALGTSTQLPSQNLPWFSSGWYTGDGWVNEVAGLVHKWEYVIPQDTLRKVPEIISGLERMRQGNTINHSKSINVPQVIVQNQTDLETLFDKLKFRL